MLGCTSIYFVGFKTMWMLQIMLNVSTFCWPRWRHSTWHYWDRVWVYYRETQAPSPLSRVAFISWKHRTWNNLWWCLNVGPKFAQQGGTTECLSSLYYFFKFRNIFPILLTILVCPAWTQWESGTWRVKLHHKDVSAAQLQLVVLKVT